MSDYENENQSDWIDSLIRNWYILILIFVYFFFNGKWGIVTFDKAQFYALAGLMFIFTGKMFWEWGKYKSPQLVWYNGSASINHNDTLNVGDWRIYRLGGIDYGYLSFPGYEGVLICPNLNSARIRMNEATPIRTQRVDLEYLPISVQKELIKNNYPIKKILFGMVSYKYEMEHKDALNLQEHIKEVNKRLTETTDLLKGKFKVVEDSVDHSARIVKRTKGNIWERFWNRKGGQDENM